MSALPFRKRLHIVTLTTFKEYLIVTVTTISKYLIVTVTIFKNYLIVTLTMFKEHLIVTFSNKFLSFHHFILYSKVFITESCQHCKIVMLHSL